MRSEKLISVVVPIYNVEKYLRRCIDSLLSQTFTDYELILVDDGSTDTSGSIADQYANENDNVVVIHQKNGGLSAARNTGIEWSLQNSNSKWISFVDSDDWVHNQYLELLYNACIRHNTKISLCHYLRTAGKVECAFEPENDSYALEPEELWCCHQGAVAGRDGEYLSATVAWGKLYAKELWQTLRYPYGKLHEDEFTTYLTVFEQKKIAIVPYVLLYYFQNQNSIVGAKWNPRRLDALEGLEKQMQFYKANGYEKAYSFAKRSYYELMVSSLTCLKNNKFYRKKIQYLIRFKMRLLKEIGRNKPISKYERYYLTVFPILFRLFLYSRSACCKLKRI